MHQGPESDANGKPIDIKNRIENGNPDDDTDVIENRTEGIDKKLPEKLGNGTEEIRESHQNGRQQHNAGEHNQFFLKERREARSDIGDHVWHQKESNQRNKYHERKEGGKHLIQEILRFLCHCAALHLRRDERNQHSDRSERRDADEDQVRHAESRIICVKYLRRTDKVCNRTITKEP